MESVTTKLLDFVVGKSALAQFIQVIVLCFIAFAALSALSSILNILETYSQSTTEILPYLYDSPQVVFQDPSQRGSQTIYPSVNAPAGLEFSYSAYILLNKTTFQDNREGLRHVFHKGSPVYKPLMCPGVFVRNNENSLVIVMNESGAWNSHCEIPNVPIGKFFHLAIVVRNMNVDVYINGNVAHRLALDSVPKQNFGDVYVFKTESFSDAAHSKDHPFIVLGAASGLVSRLNYCAFALNYEQIDRMVRAGPSSKLVSATQNLPPYLADNWWVTYYK